MSNNSRRINHGVHGVSRSVCARLQISAKISMILLYNKNFKMKELKRNTVYSRGIFKLRQKLRVTPWLYIHGVSI